MNIDLDKEYKLSLKELIIVCVLAFFAGAVMYAVAPVLIWIFVVAMLAYVGVNVYFAIKTKTNDHNP